ncbi:MAG: hypothetical protein OXI66_15250, partial [Boseongicola sp.]|nr:hypothetical protein [Boseongicola sp.]
LKVSHYSDPWHRDDWQVRCRQEFDLASDALSKLAVQEIWPTQRWQEALHAWEDDNLIVRSWGKLAPILARAPDAALQGFSRALGRWLSKLAETYEGGQAPFVALCDRILDLEFEREEEDGEDDWDPLDLAINHPVGQVTEALLQLWLRGSLDDGQGLRNDLKSIFSKVCESGEWKLRHGRVLLAAHVVALFRVDPDWTSRFLLPLFKWERSEVEARTAWKGFLWSPRLHAPLTEAFKPEFLNTASHYERLGRHGVQYSSLLTFAALDPGDVFSRNELASATAALPPNGLNNVASTLARAIEGAGERRSDYWRNRMEPYLKHVWPKTRNVASDSVADAFARVCIAAGDAFPTALKAVFIWLQPLEYPSRVVQRLHEANLQERFPEEALKLLDRIIGEETHFPPNELEDCLRTMRAKKPALETDGRFRRLAEFSGGKFA